MTSSRRRRRRRTAPAACGRGVVHASWSMIGAHDHIASLSSASHTRVGGASSSTVAGTTIGASVKNASSTGGNVYVMAAPARLVQPLDDQRLALALGDAHRLEADRLVERLEVVEQRGHAAQARHAEREAEHDW